MTVHFSGGVNRRAGSGCFPVKVSVTLNWLQSSWQTFSLKSVPTSSLRSVTFLSFHFKPLSCVTHSLSNTVCLRITAEADTQRQLLAGTLQQETAEQMCLTLDVCGWTLSRQSFTLKSFNCKCLITSEASGSIKWPSRAITEGGLFRNKRSEGSPSHKTLYGWICIFISFILLWFLYNRSLSSKECSD